MAANAPNAILAISSTDRYIISVNGRADQPIQNVLLAQYINSGPPPNDFTISAPTALMNGYIDKIIVSQIQLQYNLPTIVPAGNDLMAISIETYPGSAVFTPVTFELPYGFFNPDELAAMLATFLNDNTAAGLIWEVDYSQGYTSSITSVGFRVVLASGGSGIRFKFPDPRGAIPGVTSRDRIRLLKTYKTFGFTVENSLPQLVEQISWTTPDFLYTPYIDIYSDALTNYQKLKDTDTATSRRKGLLARIYISGVGNPVVTTGGFVNTSSGTSLGFAPFVLTYDLNTPKVINWTPDVAVNSLDFQLRDCYGDLLFCSLPPDIVTLDYRGDAFNTEFQMTLLCIEGDR